MNLTFFVKYDEEITKYLKNQAQMVFNVLYVIAGILGVALSIICAIGILMSKNNSVRRQEWITAFMWVLIGVALAFFGVGIINLLVSIGEKYRKEMATLIIQNFNTIKFYINKF